MKRTVLPVVILMAISIIIMGTVIGASEKLQPRTEAAPTVEIVQLTPSNSGNWRHPGVAEDSKGNRLAIFRGPEGTKYYYAYCAKGGTWSSPQAIAGGSQPSLVGSMYSNIEVDSSDLFHCYWENANGAVYASFRDGVWTTPIKPSLAGRYDITSALAVRSTDEVVTVDCEVQGYSKDIWLHRKGKNDSQFGSPFNLTRDAAGSTQPCVTVDSKDNIWVAWKSDYYYPDADENLVIFLSAWDANNNDMEDFIVVSNNPGWSFLPQVAVNSEDKVMTEWACSTAGQYMSRLYDPATKTLGPMASLDIGIPRIPWHSFYSRMVSHGKDFYTAALTPGRDLILLKFDEKTSRWDRIAQVSNRSVEMFALYSGYDNMLIAWNSWDESTNVYITTVGVDPFSKVKIKSVSNLTWVKNIERNFFHGYSINTLTWTANIENTQKGIIITAQRIYRKARTEDDTKWTRIAEVAGTVLKYDDRNIPAASDYVYAVTCVDDKEHESKIF